MSKPTGKVVADTMSSGNLSANEHTRSLEINNQDLISGVPIPPFLALSLRYTEFSALAPT